ncbi:Zinc finger DNA binding protein [Operophtera brumata]|uniref:Zinc finger DNA binding protein n=1 Tax=Operophtera brumata TaxID=104452 RepID=A0A0L7KX00_OPEBR|nr:Zinc finger DNA binding protein [Operophtera brumata]
MAVNHSPKSSTSTPRSMNVGHQQTQSDTNLPLLVQDDDLISIFDKRCTKRQRPNSPLSPSGNRNEDCINDLKDMLLSFQKEQSTILQKLVTDVHEIKSSKNEQSTILNKLISDISEVKQQNCQIQKTNDELGKKIEIVNNNFDHMKLQIESLQKDKTEYTRKMQQLENKIRDLERSSRPSAIEIKNVPQKTDESPEDLKSTLVKMSEIFSVPLKSSDIRDAYRFPGKPGTIKPIVAEFTSVPTKLNFLAAAKAFNRKRSLQDKLNTSHLGYLDVCSPVYVVEYLPGSMRKLFYLAKEFSKANNFKFCWSSNGRILIQKNEQSKAIHIKNEEVLDETLHQM